LRPVIDGGTMGAVSLVLVSYYCPFLLHSVPLTFQYCTAILQFISQTDKEWKPR